jgi:protein-S-isoprenylcysteine O-methyltransferase Ste14
MRLPWPPIVFASTLAGGLLGSWLFSAFVAPPAIMRWIGLAIIGAGIGLFVFAIIAMITAKTEIRPNHPAGTLQTSGPFALSRNPIYTGELLVLIGLAAWSGSWVMALAAIIFLSVMRRLIALEEAHLAARFGEAYRAYRARTPRFLGPARD